MAEPTIDLLGEVEDSVDVAALTPTMLDEGYVLNTHDCDLVMYIKGYTPTGFAGQAYHIHVRGSGDWDELYFRDYLIAHRPVAEQYAKLKTALREQYPNDRDAYTAAKSDFVKRYTEAARRKFPGRYLPRRR